MFVISFARVDITGGVVGVFPLPMHLVLKAVPLSCLFLVGCYTYAITLINGLATEAACFISHMLAILKTPNFTMLSLRF